MSWLSDSWETIKALTTAEHAPLLPKFQEIIINQVPAASALVFFGLPGNTLTERLGVNKYHCPFHVPFHAALMMRDGVFHNIGKFRTDELIVDEFRSKRRIDVISYNMTEDQRSKIMQATELDTSVPHTGLEITDYGISDFLSFGFKFIGKGKEPVCSADVVRLLGVGGITCSPHPAMESAPWDVLQYAIDNPSSCSIRTLWCGPDFHR